MESRSIYLFFIVSIGCIGATSVKSQEASTTRAAARSNAAPDPEDRAKLFNLLGLEAIQKEVGLDAKQIEVIQTLLDRSRNELRTMSRESRENGKQMSREELREWSSNRRLAYADAIEEILLPDQASRLRELTYRIEVSRLGLARALVYGRLGVKVGIYSEQDAELLRLGDKVSAEAQEKIEKILIDANEKILSSLTPEQKKKAKVFLGEFYLHQEAIFASTIAGKSSK